MNTKIHKAPWSPLLIGLSVFSSVLSIGLAFAKVHPMVTPLLIGLFVACALFTVRGYSITPEAILVHRLLWTTRLPRIGLQSARFEPKAMCKSIRVCGNGGFFSFTGYYWSRKLGWYSAYSTDPSRTVVLRYGERTVVLSPEDPEAFVRELE